LSQKSKEDFMKTRLLVLVSLLLLFVAGCSTQGPQELESQAVPVRLAVLKGSTVYPAVTGKATYKVDNNGIREFQTEISNALVLKGQTLSVFVDATKVGTMRVTLLGKARLSLVGAAAPVIALTVNPTIRVKTATGVLVARGVMNQFK
jgi:uncharacterized protein YcfL